MPSQTTPKASQGSNERSLVFRLLRLENLISKPFFSRYAGEYDLSLNEWRIVMSVASRPGITASEVCEQTGMHEMNVSRGVQRLVRTKRMQRIVDPGDRRRSMLDLTPEGAALHRRIGPEGLKREAVIQESLSAAEVAQFSRLLDKLIASFCAQAQDDPAAGKTD